MLLFMEVCYSGCHLRFAISFYRQMATCNENLTGFPYAEIHSIFSVASYQPKALSIYACAHFTHGHAALYDSEST